MALPTINGLALCAGVGMLDEGVRLAFEYLGFDYRAVCYVEREAPAAAQLVTLMEAGLIDPAPVWSDLVTFDTRPWRGLVDCITAGFPCQPHSVAGKRAGLDDDRWIWPDIARLIGELRPRFVLLENVPGLASTGGLDGCIGDLAERGYSAEWARLSAAAVGASHERERLFIFGWLADAGLQHFNVQQRPHGDEHSRGGSELADTGCESIRRHESLAIGECGNTAGADDGFATMENPARHERIGPHRQGGRRRGVCEASGELGNANGVRLARISGSGQERTAQHGNELANTSGARLQKRTGGGSNDDPLRTAERPDPFSIHRTFAPGPGDEIWEAYCSFFPYLAPAVESGVCMLADGLAMVVDESRTDQLRAIGNGVVALTAACAYVELARRAGIA